MVTPPLFFYLPAYWQTEGATVVGGATGTKHGGEAVRALSPTALAPKRGTPYDATSGQAFILGEAELCGKDFMEPS